MKWERRTLEEIADFSLGKMLDQKKNKGILYPYLANLNVRWGSFNLEDLRQMRFEPHEIERYSLKAGDIVMCEGGEPGRCAIWKGGIAGVMFQKALHRIRPRSGINHQFLFYSLLQQGKSGGLDRLFTGSTIKHLPREKLAKVELFVPPLPIQERIASILSPYDDLIEVNRQRIALLEGMAQELFDEWFVRLSFPGSESSHLLDSPLGPIPSDWRLGTLGDLVYFKTGFPFKSSTFCSNGEHRVVTIRNVQDGSFDPHCESRTDEIPAKLPAYCRLDDGDILLSLTGNVGRACLVYNGPFLLNQRVAVLHPIEPINWALAYCTFRDSSMRKKLELISNGVAQQNLSPVVAASMPFALPSHELRVRFDRLVRPMLDQMLVLYRAQVRLAAARDLILPRLISGELSIANAADQLEAAA